MTTTSARIPAKYGEVEFVSNRVFGKVRPKRAFYVWPEDESSLEALMAGRLTGPFESEAAAKEFAEAHWYEVQQ